MRGRRTFHRVALSAALFAAWMAAVPSIALSLSTTPSWTGEGNQANAHYGWSVAPAGDVDGDGFTDLIVGAREHDAGQSNEGRVYLYRGSAAGPSLTDDWRAESNQLLAFFGTSVAPAGDVNGDGYGDVIVGAPSWDGDLSNEGAAFVFLGGPSGLAATAAQVLEGDQAGAAFGGCVAGAGDVNGDGYDDVIVGARGHDTTLDAAGRAAVFLGGPSGVATTAVWNVYGDQTDAALGGSVAGAGDVNGDGYADVIVGAFFRDAGQTDEGCAFVYLGGPGGPAGTPTWTGEGEQAGAHFGWSVAGAGDVNGDGWADVIVGARQHDTTVTDGGRAWLFRGTASGIDATAAWHVDGDEAGALLGWSVATAGDVNGDGYADVIVGAYKADVVWLDAGEATVYLGSPAGLSTTAAWSASSSQAGAQYGWSVSGAGDVDGDGFGDVVVGAPFQDAGQVDEGGAFLYRGGASLPEAAPSWRASGGASNVAYGFAVAAGGDVNGDGFGEILVADPFATAGGDGRLELLAGAAPVPGTSASWVGTGAAGEGYARAIAFAGDVNGDGFVDFLVGAPFAATTFAAEGRAVLHVGSALGPSVSPAWSALGGAAGAELGAALAAAGDVDGDGLADVLIGAPGADGLEAASGVVHVYRGHPGGAPLLFAGTRPGPQIAARYGAAVASAGDVNRDGYSDVLIGEPAASAGEIEQGRAHLLLGGSGGLAFTDAWSFEGGQAEAHLGESVASAGDVNGDGFSDVLVAAPDHDGGAVDDGRAYLFLGGPGGLADTPAWEWSPGQAGARLDAVTAAGDVDEDGYGDVLVGVSQWDGGFANEGKVVLFRGTANGLATAPARTWLGGAAQARFGASLGGRGDADGDGAPDLLVGARGWSDSTSSGGAAFLLFANGAEGPTRRIRQRRADDSAPVALLGVSDATDAFRIATLGRSAAGRADVALEWEVKALGIPFGGAATRGGWVEPGAPVPGDGSRVELTADVTGLVVHTPHRWRVRTRARSPYFPTTPWRSPAGNDASETDLRTASPPAAVLIGEPGAEPALEAFPSPFRESVTIRFTVRREGPVRLDILDVVGRRVVTLVDDRLPPGLRRVEWDGRNRDGRPVAPGAYFLRLDRNGEVGGRSVIRRR